MSVLNYIENTPNTFNFFTLSEKIINLLMKHGKKLQATNLFFETLLLLKKKMTYIPKKTSSSNHTVVSQHVSVLEIVESAIQNVTPYLEVRKVRVAGSTYLVPSILSKKKQESLAIRWLIDSAKKKQKNTRLNFSECFADEIIDASKKQGQARQKRDELHRLAEVNRAYIRYRWW
jgi:small subunit ribosomal protein S7